MTILVHGKKEIFKSFIGKLRFLAEIKPELKIQ